MRRGRYLGESRDGAYDRVWWDGATKPRAIGKGFIEAETPSDAEECNPWCGR